MREYFWRKEAERTEVIGGVLVEMGMLQHLKGVRDL